MYHQYLYNWPERDRWLAQVMAPNRKIFALKRIKLQGKDSEASKGFVDEITLLQRLRGKQNIIQLVDAEVHSHSPSRMLHD